MSERPTEYYELRSPRSVRGIFRFQVLLGILAWSGLAWLALGGSLEGRLAKELFVAAGDGSLAWGVVAAGGVFVLTRSLGMAVFGGWVLSTSVGLMPFHVLTTLLKAPPRWTELPGESRTAVTWAGIALAAAALEWARRSAAIPKTSDRSGSAGFASAREVRRHGALWSDDGIPLAKLGSRRLRDGTGYSLMVLAPTGAGKTTGTLAPAVLDHPGSVVVIDPKGGEIFQLTSGYRQKVLGQKIIALDFENPVHGFNPLDFIPRDGRMIAYANELAWTLANPEGRDLGGNEEFWVVSASQLIAAGIVAAIYQWDGRPRLYDIARMFSENLQSVFNDWLADGRLPDYVHDAAEFFRQMEEKTLMGILATVGKALAIYRDPQIAKLTRESSFDLATLREEATSVYLTLPPHRATVLQPILRMFITLVINRLVEKPSSEDDRELLLVIDELPVLQKFRQLERALGFIRSYKIRALVALQNLSQLHNLYGRHPELLDLCRTRLMYPTTDPESAKKLSEALGKMTVATDQRSVSHGKSKGRSKTESETGRSLFTPDEIMRMDPKSCVIVHPGLRPVLAEWAPWFRERGYRRAVEHGAAEIEPLEAFQADGAPGREVLTYDEEGRERVEVESAILRL